MLGGKNRFSYFWHLVALSLKHIKRVRFPLIYCITLAGNCLQFSNDTVFRTTNLASGLLNIFNELHVSLSTESLKLFQSKDLKLPFNELYVSIFRLLARSGDQDLLLYFKSGLVFSSGGNGSK